MLRPAVPAGFREVSGLVVPESAPRDREVWTKDEKKLIDRVTRMLRGRKIRLVLKCADDACDLTPLEFIPVRENGEFILRCPHLDRVFTRAV